MRDGYVYILRAIGLNWSKIGWAKNIARRMVELADLSGSDLELLGCFRGTQADEYNLQKQFSHLRIARDWFLADGELLAFACSLENPIRISFVNSSKPGDTYYLLRFLLRAKNGLRGPHYLQARSRLDLDY